MLKYKMDCAILEALVRYACVHCPDWFIILFEDISVSKRDRVEKLNDINSSTV